MTVNLKYERFLQRQIDNAEAGATRLRDKVQKARADLVQEFRRPGGPSGFTGSMTSHVTDEVGAFAWEAVSTLYRDAAKAAKKGEVSYGHLLSKVKELTQKEEVFYTEECQRIAESLEKGVLTPHLYWLTSRTRAQVYRECLDLLKVYEEEFGAL
jgi:hypothetical protein